jgi:hypothetical protein
MDTCSPNPRYPPSFHLWVICPNIAIHREREQDLKGGGEAVDINLGQMTAGWYDRTEEHPGGRYEQ